MSFDSDVALLGTGVATLVAATHLLAEGKSVLLLNPGWDFFLEDSELPFDPLLTELDSLQLRRNSVEMALESLRPEFPGAVEQWSEVPVQGFRDRSAPYVRARGRLWVSQTRVDELEERYIVASEAGYSPQILEGLQVAKRFPGAPLGGDWSSEGLRGLWVPRFYDVDVTRYRNGLLEFVRERADHVVCDATQIELTKTGVRFHFDGRIHHASLNDGLLVFWTPRLTQWVLKQARIFEGVPLLPRGIRLWEQWSLMSRSNLHPGVVGTFEDCTVWAEVEGDPDEKGPLNQLEMLRAGPLIAMDAAAQGVELRKKHLFNVDSFQRLQSFFYAFLRWEKLTVRGMKSRAIFEWDPRLLGRCWSLSHGPLRTRVVTGCDGPLADVVNVARQSCEELS